MHLFSIALFVISADLDSFVIGLSYGVRKIKIGFRSNLLIGIMTLAGTYLSMICGRAMLNFIPTWVAEIFGNSIIILIGVYCLASFLIRKYTVRKEIHASDTERINYLSTPQALALGMGLTVNNIGLGIGASIAGFPIAATSIGAFVFNLLLLWMGNRLGHSWLSRLIGEYAEPLSGILIILMGLYEIFF